MYYYIGASVDGRLPFWCACFANKFLSLSLSQEPEHGRVEVGGRPGTRRRWLVAGVRLHTKKGDAQDAAAELLTIPHCN